MSHSFYYNLKNIYHFYLRDEALDVPGLGSLAALDEVVCCAVADDQEQEAAGVLVFVLTGELLLQVVHLLAVQVRVDLNIKPFMSNLIIQELIRFRL